MRRGSPVGDAEPEEAGMAKQIENGETIGSEEQDLTVKVFAPRRTEPKEFKWNKHVLVGDAAKEAATAFQYAAGTPTFVKGDTTLDRSKQLHQAGVEDGDELELTDVGGGV
jgi:hypothetical protein